MREQLIEALQEQQALTTERGESLSEDGRAALVRVTRKIRVLLFRVGS